MVNYKVYDFILDMIFASYMDDFLDRKNSGQY